MHAARGSPRDTRPLAHHDLPVAGAIGQRARRGGKQKRPIAILFHGRHERVTHQHRDVEVAQLAPITLGVGEGLDVRMIAAKRSHHRATAGARRKKRGASAVPDAHEGYRSGGDGAGSRRLRALRAQSGKVIADAAALLHGERALLERVEDPRQRIRDRSHDETVEQRDLPGRARAGQDATTGQELEVLQQRVKTLAPAPSIMRLDARDRLGDPRPGIVDAHLPGPRIGIPVSGLPEVLRDGRGEARAHGGIRGRAPSLTRPRFPEA